MKSALEDSSLIAVQSCTTAKEVWKKLQMRYAVKRLLNKFSVLNDLLNVKMKREELMGHKSKKLESIFAHLFAMNVPVLESMQVAILVSSLCSVPQHSTVIASINTKHAEEVNWYYISMTFFQRQSRHRNLVSNKES